jgi:hypothetical protein
MYLDVFRAPTLVGLTFFPLPLSYTLTNFANNPRGESIQNVGDNDFPQSLLPPRRVLSPIYPLLQDFHHHLLPPPARHSILLHFQQPRRWQPEARLRTLLGAQRPNAFRAIEHNHKHLLARLVHPTTHLRLLALHLQHSLRHRRRKRRLTFRRQQPPPLRIRAPLCPQPLRPRRTPARDQLLQPLLRLLQTLYYAACNSHRHCLGPAGLELRSAVLGRRTHGAHEPPSRAHRLQRIHLGMGRLRHFLPGSVQRLHNGLRLIHPQFL